MISYINKEYLLYKLQNLILLNQINHDLLIPPLVKHHISQYLHTCS